MVLALFLQLTCITVSAESGDTATVGKGDIVDLVITNTYGPTGAAQPSIIFVFYDTDVFEYVNNSLKGYGDFENATVELRYTATKENPFVPGDTTSTGGATWADATSGLRFQIDQWRGSAADSKGDVATLKLRVKEGADLDSLGNSFTITAKSQDGGRGTPPSGYISVNPSQITISDTTNPPPPSSSIYTVTPTGNTNATVGESFNVVVTLTADPATSKYAQAQAELTYNPSFVTPDLEELTNKVSKNGTDKLTITFGPMEDTEVGEEGVTLATIPFTPTPAAAGEKAVFGVSENANLTFITLKDTGSAKIGATSGDDLEVTIAQATSAVVFDEEYNGLPAGYKLLTYRISGTPTVHTYNNNPMHLVSKGDENYMTYIVADDVTPEAAEALIVSSGTAYEKSADADGSGDIDISDAQIAHDLADPSGYYNTLDNLSIAARLGADVNGDGVVTQADAEAVIYAIHHNGALPSSN
jgi:hypothetical protein